MISPPLANKQNERRLALIRSIPRPYLEVIVADLGEPRAHLLKSADLHYAASELWTLHPERVQARIIRYIKNTL